MLTSKASGTQGEKYKRICKRKEKGETKKQAQWNENKEKKCQIRNIFKNGEKTKIRV